MPPVGKTYWRWRKALRLIFLAARFSANTGHGYDKAVKSFSPYTETKVVNEDARAAGKTLIEKAKKIKRLPSYVFINNRLEGSPLHHNGAPFDDLTNTPIAPKSCGNSAKHISSVLDGTPRCDGLESCACDDLRRSLRGERHRPRHIYERGCAVRYRHRGGDQRPLCYCRDTGGE